MPGTEYTIQELQAMSTDDFAAARVRDFRRPGGHPEDNVGLDLSPQARDEREDKLAALEEQVRSMTASTYRSSPVPLPPQAQTYADTAASWASGGEFDFTTPSGSLCRLKPLPIEDLAANGMLDRLSRLPGITDELIQKSEGQPPTPVADTAKLLPQLITVLNEVLPLVVVKPTITPIPDANEDGTPGEREASCIYPDSIPFADRVAILDKVSGGLVKFDSFRK